MLDIRLLGSLELWLDDFQAQLPALKPRLVLICLATSTGFAATVDTLVNAVWGDEPPKSAINSLHVYISTLRQLLGPGSIVSSGQTYSLDPSTVVDLERFAREVRAGTDAIARRDDIAAAAWLSRGLSRWRGVPLATEVESDFVAAIRSGAIDLWLHALEGWADVRTRTGHAAGLTEELAEPVRQHPFREVLRARYIVALGASGRQTEALAEYGSARSDLREGLGVEPGSALTAAQAAVLRNELPEAETGVGGGIRLGLAAALGTLIGRERELESLKRLVHNPTARVVTVLGHGGIGKTRLAQELVLHDAANSAFVSLTAAERTEDIVPLISSQLGVGERERPLEALVLALSGHAHELVLVLDNLEHLAGVSAVIAEIVSAAPLVTVVATSRIPLGMPGERRLMLQPLDSTTSDDRIMSPAAELLLDRVWSYNESFVPSMDELADAAAIVRLCEGVPLSIEMAAARTTVFTLRELRERLSLSLSTLIAETDKDDGAASTGAVVRWTISALGPAARAALKAASTFRGGFTSVALAGVLGSEVDEAAESLRILIEYALVSSTTTAGVRRFDQLEVIRAVVRASATAEELSELDDAHTRYFRSTLGHPAPGEFFPTRLSELVTVAADRSNYRHAVVTALHSNVPLAGELIDLLGVAWMRVGSPAELKDWIEALLESPDIAPNRRMSCLIHLLRIDQTEGNARADDLFRRLHAIEPEVDDWGQRAKLASFEAIYAMDRGDAAAVTRAASTIEAMPTNQVVAYSLSLARVSYFMLTENTDELIAELEAFLEWASRDGLEIHCVSATQNLIYALELAGRYVEAADLAIQQLDVVLESDIMSRIFLLQDAGESLLRLGQIDAAITNLELSVSLARGFGSDRILHEGIFRLAAARMEDDPRDPDAAFLAGMALASIAQSSIELDTPELALVEDYLSEVRDAAEGTPLAVARDAGARALAESGLVAGAELAAARGRAIESPVTPEGARIGRGN